MLPPCNTQCSSGLRSPSEAPNPSAMLLGQHASAVPALCLVLNEDIEELFFSWIEVVEATDKAFSAFVHMQ